MRDRYELLRAEVERYLAGERGPLHEVERAAALVRWAREVRRVDGVDTSPLIARVLARFEQDYYGDDGAWSQEVQHKAGRQPSAEGAQSRERSG